MSELHYALIATAVATAVAFALCFALFIWLRKEKRKNHRLSSINKERGAECKDMSTVIEEWRSYSDSLAARNAELEPLEKYKQIEDLEAELNAKKAAFDEEEQRQLQKLSEELDALKERESLINQAHELMTQRSIKLKEDEARHEERLQQIEISEQAIRNIIHGYGNQYLLSPNTAIAELSELYLFNDAGQRLKEARSATKGILKIGNAATSEYLDADRRAVAIRLVLDAFNAKADAILAQAKNENYGISMQQMKDAYLLINNNGRAFRNTVVTLGYLDARLDELKWIVAVQALKQRQQDEQRAIRERMRDEDRARKEYERTIKDAQKEQEYYEKAMVKAKEELAKASVEQRVKFETQISELELKLKEAEEKNQRALSMAQQTRAGNVYIISNIGSFGENVYKIGMTRRLEPMERVHELGDASVPFPFDVHAIVYSDDAPTLEKELHKVFLRDQMNKVNPRKEFFKSDLSRIRSVVESKGFNATWTMLADAQQYRETIKIEEQISSNPQVRDEWERYAAIVDDIAFDEDYEKQA